MLLPEIVDVLLGVLVQLAPPGINDGVEEAVGVRRREGTHDDAAHHQQPDGTVKYLELYHGTDLKCLEIKQNVNKSKFVNIPETPDNYVQWLAFLLPDYLCYFLFNISR